MVWTNCSYLFTRFQHAKKSFEVLIKLRAVLILDLPDFIRDFILNLKNKLDAYIKRTLNKGEKSNKGVDEFEILKWLIHKISLDLNRFQSTNIKRYMLFYLHVFYSIVRSLRSAVITAYAIGSKSAASCSIECQHL
jgi:hypothetical protein